MLLEFFFKLKFAPLPPTNLQSAFKSMGALLLIVGALLQVCGRFTTCLPQGTLWQYQMCNLALLMFYTYSQRSPDSCPTSTYAVFLHANYSYSKEHFEHACLRHFSSHLIGSILDFFQKTCITRLSCVPRIQKVFTLYNILIYPGWFAFLSTWRSALVSTNSFSISLTVNFKWVNQLLMLQNR